MITPIIKQSCVFEKESRIEKSGGFIINHMDNQAAS